MCSVVLLLTAALAIKLLSKHIISDIISTKINDIILFITFTPPNILFFIISTIKNKFKIYFLTLYTKSYNIFNDI